MFEQEQYKEVNEKKENEDLEVDIGAIRELFSEIRVAKNILPLSGAVLPNSGEQRLLLLRRPL